MRESASATMFHAANKCEWDDEQKMTVYCSHIATLIPDGDLDKLFSTTKAWALDSGIPMEMVLLCLARVIDEIEVAPDYRGEKFTDYVKSLMEASCASKTADKEEKPKPAKTGKGRKAKGAVATAKPKVEKKVAKRSPTPPPARSEPKKEPEQKFPAGTVNPPEIQQVPPEQRDIAHQPQVTAQPKIFLVGYLEQAFNDVAKQLLALEAPCKDQRLGALMARQKFATELGMELVLELINGRPKPGVYVELRKDGKSLCPANVVREYTNRFEITYNGTTYKVLPPGD